MICQNYSYNRMIPPVLAFLRSHAGLALTAEELCQQLGCTPMQVRIALEVLVRSGLVRKERSGSEGDRYTCGRP